MIWPLAAITLKFCTSDQITSYVKSSSFNVNNPYFWFGWTEFSIEYLLECRIHRTDLLFMKFSSLKLFVAAYFGGTILVLSLCTATTVFVLNIHHRGVFKTRVPHWARKLILEWLATPLRMNTVRSTSQVTEQNVSMEKVTDWFWVKKLT